MKKRKFAYTIGSLTLLILPLSMTLSCTQQEKQSPIFYYNYPRTDFTLWFKDRHEWDLVPVNEELEYHTYFYYSWTNSSKQIFNQDLLANYIALDQNNQQIIPEIIWLNELNVLAAGNYSVILRATDQDNNSTDLKINYIVEYNTLRFKLNKLIINQKEYQISHYMENYGYLVIDANSDVTAKMITNLISGFNDAQHKDLAPTFEWKEPFNSSVAGTYSLAAKMHDTVDGTNYNLTYNLDVIVK